MGAKVTFIPTTKIIQVTEPPNVSGTVSIDFQVDVYSDGKEDWQTTGTLTGMIFPVRPVGGDPIDDTTSLGATFFLVNGWRIRPYEADHFFDLQGNVFTEEGDPPVIATTGSWNVLTLGARSNIINLVDNSTSGGSFSGSVTASVDVDAIADAVWRAPIDNYLNETGSMSVKVLQISKDTIFVK